MEAVVVRKTISQSIVRCPYCSKTHPHGNMERDTIHGQYRSSHCSKGEYRIVEKII